MASSNRIVHGGSLRSTSSAPSTSSGPAIARVGDPSRGLRTVCVPRSSAARRVIPEPYGALFRGLVIGDDRDQPEAMIERFRASGLSHLTAVSGQNVSFLLAACGPLLVRLRPRPRWMLTLCLIAWFVVLTRFEPSILRAGAMAMLSATAFLTGRERSPVRLLAVAVLILVLIDPLLVWSVGFWLSVGATAGVCVVGPPLARRLARVRITRDAARDHAGRAARRRVAERAGVRATSTRQRRGEPAGRARRRGGDALRVAGLARGGDRPGDGARGDVARLRRHQMGRHRGACSAHASNRSRPFVWVGWLVLVVVLAVVVVLSVAIR